MILLPSQRAILSQILCHNNLEYLITILNFKLRNGYVTILTVY